MPGRRASNFHSESGEIISADKSSNHLKSTACQAKTQGPHGRFARPVHKPFQIGDVNGVVEVSFIPIPMHLFSRHTQAPRGEPAQRLTFPRSRRPSACRKWLPTERGKLVRC